MKRPKHVEVEYIESGAFQGSEGDCFRAGIAFGEDCIVMKKSDFHALFPIPKKKPPVKALSATAGGNK